MTERKMLEAADTIVNNPILNRVNIAEAMHALERAIVFLDRRKQGFPVGSEPRDLINQTVGILLNDIERFANIKKRTFGD